jgi:type II secretory pathway component GspD/PulD (secretin)
MAGSARPGPTGRPEGSIPQLPLAEFGLAALALTWSACATPPEAPEPEDRPIDLELFQRILAEGRIEPAVLEEDEPLSGAAGTPGAPLLPGRSESAPLVPADPDTPGAPVEGDPVAAGAGGGGEAPPAAPDEASPADPFDDLGSLIADAEQNDPTPISPYLEFGSQIYVYENGFVMKPYSFPAGVGEKALSLLQTYGDFPIHGAGTDGAGLPDPAVAQPEDAVVLDLRKNWSVEAWSDPRKPGMAQPTAVTLGDLLLVTARPEVLFEVEHFLKIFLEQVKQIEIEAKIVEVSLSDRFDYGIKPLNGTTPIFGLPNAGGLVRSVDYSFGNTVNGTEALFNVGAVFDGVEFNALLELVSTEERVEIQSHPRVVTREGGRAEIINTEQIPFFNVQNINANGNFTTAVQYRDVGVQMYVIPRVVGEDTVILNIDIEASAQSGTAVAFTQQGSSSNNAVVTVPQIASRRATTVVRLEPGQAVVIGGLISSRTLDRESKVPFFGDIPIVGNLFKSKFQETEKTNILFYIRPRVLQGGDLNAAFGD